MTVVPVIMIVIACNIIVESCPPFVLSSVVMFI